MENTLSSTSINVEAEVAENSYDQNATKSNLFYVPFKPQSENDLYS